MSAAEALPPVSPWHDTSKITDRIPSRAELAACPPADPGRLASHHANMVKLTTQAAWQVPAPAPGVEPFTVSEMVLDRLDEAADLFDALVEAGAEDALADRDTDWPTNEPTGWN